MPRPGEKRGRKRAGLNRKGGRISRTEKRTRPGFQGQKQEESKREQMIESPCTNLKFRVGKGSRDNKDII